MRLLLIAVVPLLLAARDTLLPHGFRQPSRATVKACPDLRRIDYAALGHAAVRYMVRYGNNEMSAHLHIRGPYPYPVIDGPDLVLSTIAAASVTQDQPTRTSSVVWRKADGRWMMDRVDFMDPMSIISDPNGKPYTQAELDRLQRRHLAGPLSSEQARALNAALSHRCFAAEPDWLDVPIPAIHDGGPPDIEGYGGAGGSVTFEHAGRTWSMYHAAPREQFRAILNAVLYARPEQQAHFAK